VLPDIMPSAIGFGEHRSTVTNVCVRILAELAGIGPADHLVFSVAEWLKYWPELLWGHEELRMEWTTPDFVEIELNCEINSYANAEL